MVTISSWPRDYLPPELGRLTIYSAAADTALRFSSVLFRSDRILHRVRPSTAERFCLTVWIDGDNQTSIAGIFAAGDLTPGCQDALAAAAEGASAAKSALTVLAPRQAAAA